MIDREEDAPRMSGADNGHSAEVVIAVGKLVYRSYKQSPELAAFDPTTLWPVIHDSCGTDAEARSLLGDVKDTRAWSMAVRLAKLMRDMNAAAPLEEESG